MIAIDTKLFTQIGSATGFTTGAIKGIDAYYEHFASETWVRVLDAAAITTATTILGTLIALTLTLAFKKIFKQKE